MLELRTYAKAELSALLGNKDKQGLDRKLKRWDIEFSSTGRGDKLVYEIKKINDEFKVYCMLNFKFAAQTEFNVLAVFVYLFFGDDDFMIQPLGEMSIRMGIADTAATRQTLGTWKKKFKEYQLFNESSEYEYYSVSHGIRHKITKGEYSMAWMAYYNYVKKHSKDSDYNEYFAFCEMYDIISGRAVKRPHLDKNAFYLEIIETLVVYAVESIEKHSKSN